MLRRGMKMDPGEICLAFCCYFSFFLVLVGMGAVFLRSACYFCRVPVPSYPRAIGVVFVTGLALILADVGVMFVLTVVLGSMGGPWDTVEMRRLLLTSIDFPLDMLIAAAIYRGLLQGVSFGKAIVLYLVQLLIVVVITLLMIGLVLL